MAKRDTNKHRIIREDDAVAFLDEFGRPIDDARSGSGMPQFLGREFVRAATSGEAHIAEGMDEILPEEAGGPFIETSAAEEFGSLRAYDPTLGDEVEATPTSSAPPVVRPRRR
ncbi:MAG: hypothetical protein SGI86_01525 [Deltaproteobacteria bacterium]|nr:hypothetical protein [Deltaproteobacteria bacterium]